MDCMWLNRWSEFVNTDSLELPGPISSADLLDGNNNPIAGLKPKIDYRALPAVAFFILKQLHGSDGSPDLPRYSLDIYKPPVPIDRLVNIQMTAVVRKHWSQLLIALLCLPKLASVDCISCSVQPFCLCLPTMGFLRPV